MIWWWMKGGRRQPLLLPLLQQQRRRSIRLPAAVDFDGGGAACVPHGEGGSHGSHLLEQRFGSNIQNCGTLGVHKPQNKKRGGG
jgi:hypothetical protein